MFHVFRSSSPNILIGKGITRQSRNFEKSTGKIIGVRIILQFTQMNHTLPKQSKTNQVSMQCLKTTDLKGIHIEICNRIISRCQLYYYYYL